MTSVKLSDNCDSYTDHASSYVNYTAIHPQNESCRVEGSIWSCQTSQYEEPDKMTSESINRHVREQASSSLSCEGLDLSAMEIDTKSVILGARSTELSGEDIAKRYMASNCANNFDISNINTHNYYTCRNFGEMENEKGDKFRNYHKTWEGVLPSCEEGISFAKQTEEDVKKLVQYRNKLQGVKMNLSDLACNIFGSSV